MEIVSLDAPMLLLELLTTVGLIPTLVVVVDIGGVDDGFTTVG